MTVRQQFIDYLHERAREHYNTYRLVGRSYSEHRSFYVRARLRILETLSRSEEWDENRD